MKKYLVKYYGGELVMEANSTREAEKLFEEKYQDVIYAVMPVEDPLQTPENDHRTYLETNGPKV